MIRHLWAVLTSAQEAVYYCDDCESWYTIDHCHF